MAMLPKYSVSLCSNFKWFKRIYFFKYCTTNRHHSQYRLKTQYKPTIENSETRVRVLSNKKDKSDSNWISTIGLEVHAQIASETKLFSASAANEASRAPTNTQVSFFDASIPGTLPVLNRHCVEAGIKTALALNCKINEFSTFDRKHYFYADLPAGYQITQQRNPLAIGGELPFSTCLSGSKALKDNHEGFARIVQLQLEQDSGKSLHDEESGRSLIDLNRCGVGLMEIVFHPDLFDGKEAVGLVRELSLILKCVGSCTCRMEEGALRVDANISVRRPGEELGVRTEVKNLNSLKSVELAIEHEVLRQIQILEKGGIIENETRSFDVESRVTVPMRDKEVKQDYRFMPEPNLPPLRLIDKDESSGNPNILNVATYRNTLPELPHITRSKLREDYELSTDHIYRLLEDPILLEYFYEVIKALNTRNQSIDLRRCAKMTSQLIFCDLENIRSKWNLGHINELQIRPQYVARAAEMKVERELSPHLIRTLLDLMCEEKYRHWSLDDIVSEQGWLSNFRDKDRIELIVMEAIKDHKKLVGKYIRGNTKGFDNIVRNIFKKHGSDLDPHLVRTELTKQLEHLKSVEL